MDWQTIPPEFSAVLVAVAGGIAKYMNDIVQGKPFVLSLFLANVFIAGFAGFIFFQFSQSIGMSGKSQSMIAGIGGFMGVEGLRFLQNILLHKFSIQYTERSRQGGPPLPTSKTSDE